MPNPLFLDVLRQAAFSPRLQDPAPCSDTSAQIPGRAFQFHRLGPFKNSPRCG